MLLEADRISSSAIVASSRKLRLLPLIAATYFMVSGGPYGLEDIVGRAGFGWTLALLIVLPVVWSLPTGLMVGELAGAMPEDGGFYVWVRRALGPFWGFQEAWLSLVASVFDMALYPALFVAYLGMLAPSLVAGHRGLAWGAGVVAVCVAWNLLGAYDVGEGARWMFVLFLLPFVAIVGLGAWYGISHPLGARDFRPPGGGLVPSHGAFGAALLVALWNTMGWDNASTVAREVERPQRTYIVAMLGAVAVVTVSYVLPVAASAAAGISASEFATGAWVAVARRLAGSGAFGHWLPVAVTVGGCLTAVGMFNALTMSYARLPYAMAMDANERARLDGKPAGQFAARWLAKTNRRRVPWVCVLGLGCCWLLALGLSFSRLIVVDVTIYGASLLLEFVALAVLRVREPEMPRPFRVPGGMPVAVLLGVPSALLLGYAAWASRAERMAGHPALGWCAGLALLGPVVWLAVRGRR
jgi:amino acid transporter